MATIPSLTADERRRVVELLAAYGVDADKVSAEDYNQYGYRVVADGPKTFGTKRKAWPEGFPYNAFLRIMTGQARLEE